jgi:hypothetical protein
MGARRGGGDLVKKSLGESGRWAEHCHEPLSMGSEGGRTCTFGMRLIAIYHINKSSGAVR